MHDSTELVTLLHNQVSNVATGPMHQSAMDTEISIVITEMQKPFQQIHPGTLAGMLVGKGMQYD